MHIETRVGFMRAVMNDAGALTELKFVRGGEDDGGPVNADVVRQLQEYMAGKRSDFDFALAPEGTPFQKLVWEELRRIPYGTTISYGELARRVGRPGAARAVGLANGANPIAIVVPCHRVIEADGTLTGYAFGVDMKRQLLDLERGSLLPI